MRALITGVAGFIGSHLAERLVRMGVEVVGVDCFTDYYSPERKRANLLAVSEHESFQLVESDLRKGFSAELLADGDIVFHLAAQPGVRRSWGQEFEVYTASNILATQALLEAVRDVDISRFVYASSSSVYGNAEAYPTREEALPQPVSPYGVTKLAAEHLVYLYAEKFDIPTVALRYFTVYGPRQRPDMAFTKFIDSILTAQPIEVYGDGHQVRDFTFVEDVIEATVAAGLERGASGVYNIAGGSETTILDVTRILERLTGERVNLSHGPAVAGDARRTAGDFARARRDLDYQPTRSLEEGLTLQVDHMMNNARAIPGRRQGP